MVWAVLHTEKSEHRGDDLGDALEGKLARCSALNMVLSREFARSNAMDALDDRVGGPLNFSELTTFGLLTGCRNPALAFFAPSPPGEWPAGGDLAQHGQQVMNPITDYVVLTAGP